ncbi:hypothetical protein JG688_00018307 [Phytophthora aleatoria]|uniref:HAT C-terminal dimerisation domain-containing protein n=1 Tax=Phytophthora aleatoria TaxID=2496075 RepID=A0A8J5IC98_9STRA|nr:hypothetical protein JG688_00018307 [Phytophthora aleatoria]
MQQRLHPIYKCPRLSLNAVVVLVCRQHGLDTREACTKRDRVNEKIREKLLTLMKTVAEPIDAAEPPPTPITYFNELETLFAPPLRRPQVITSDRMQRHNAEELDRWNDDPIEVERSPNGTPESVLSFWRRIEHQSDFKVLSRAARVLFAIPASSCQIERDFSVSGSMVTAQRTSLSQHNIDMCSFLNRNREFVDLLQCEPIPKGTHRRHTPSCFTYPLDLDMDMTIDDFADEILANFISNSSLCEEEKDSI